MLTGLSVLCFAVVAVSCADAADEKPAPKRGGDPDAMFKKLDANGDGFLTKDEFEKMTAQIKEKLGDKAEFLGKMFDGQLERLDADKDGKVSADEFKKGRGGFGGFGGKGKGKFGGNPEDIKKKIEDLKGKFGGNPEDFKKKLEERRGKGKGKFGGNPEEFKKKLEELKGKGKFGGNPEEFKKKLEELRNKKKDA